MAAALRSRVARAPARVMSHAALGAAIALGAVVGGLALPAGPASATFPQPQARQELRRRGSMRRFGYDPETRQVVMFGGLSDEGALADTWVWNGSV